MDNFLLNESYSFSQKLENLIYHIQESILFQDIMKSITLEWWEIILIALFILLILTLLQKYFRGQEIQHNTGGDFQQNQNIDSQIKDKKNKELDRSKNSIQSPQDMESQPLKQECNFQFIRENEQYDQKSEQQKTIQEVSHSIVEIKTYNQPPPQKQFEQNKEDIDLINKVYVGENEKKPDDQNQQINLQIHKDLFIQINSSQQVFEIEKLKQNLEKDPQKQEEQIQKQNQPPQFNQNSQVNTQFSSEFQSQINQQSNDMQFNENQFEEIIEESQGKQMIQESSGLLKINYAYQILNQRFYIPSFKSRQIDDEVLKNFVRDFKNVQEYKEEYNLDDSQDELFKDQLQYFIPIRGDGNCLFTSIGLLYVYYNLIDDKRFKKFIELIKLTEFEQVSKNNDNEILYKIETEEEQNILKQEFLDQIVEIKNFIDHQKLLQQVILSINNHDGPFYGLLIIFMRNYFRKLLQDFSKIDEIGYIQNPDQIDEIITWEYMYNETDIALKLFATEEQILIRCYQKMNIDDKIVQISEYKEEDQNQFQYKIGLAFQPGHYNAIKLYD